MGAVYVQWPSRVAGATAWTSVVGPTATRVVPDGCLDLIWSDGAFFVAGPDTRARMYSGTSGAVLSGLRFAPGVGPRVLGLPAAEVTDACPAVEAIWAPHEVRRIVDLLAVDPLPVLEDVAERRLAAAPPPGGLIDAVVRLTRRGVGVSDIADAVGLSPRQLHRRCLDAFGYGAKTLARILRMDQAIELARSGTSFARAAAVAGYADQAHLARDVKDLAGVPLGQLIR